MRYSASGTIGLSSETKMRLESKVAFTTPSQNNVTLTSETDEKWTLTIELEASGDAEAEELAKSELDRTCDLLSIFYNLSIISSGITGMSFYDAGKGFHGVVLKARIGLSADHVLTANEPALAKLAKDLHKGYPDDFMEAIFLWRQAIGRNSDTDRFFSLYRLMEGLLGGGRTLDSWIQQKEPSVKMYPANNYRNYPHTVYTYLRDNVHSKPGQRLFPVDEISANRARFQSLVKTYVAQRFQVNLG